MKAFEIYLNGRYLLTAGVGPDGVLTSVVRWAGGAASRRNAGLGFHVGGVDGSTGEHVDWSVPPLSLGDSVTIRVVEADEPSPEHRRYIYERAEAGAERRRHREQAGEETA